MNDYKELVGKLRHYAEDADENIYGICVNTPKTMLLAANAIEQLVTDIDVVRKERDELLIRAWVAERELLTHSSRISQLETENAKLKAEREAAVGDLRIADRNCRFCKFYDKTYKKGKYCSNDDGCDYCENDHWEWRGVQKESE